MKYYALKFDSKSTADSILLTTDYDGPRMKYVDTDVIGTISGATGWHVNMVFQDIMPSELAPYVITFPLYPKRVYFRQTQGVL